MENERTASSAGFVEKVAEAEPFVTGVVQLETGILLGTAEKTDRLD